MEKEMATHSSTLAWNIPWMEGLVGYSPRSCEESDTTEQLHFHFSLSRTGEGNGNPLQCCCLENPRDGGAWWAAVYGVTQSQTRLKRLSSSSSSSRKVRYFLVRCAQYINNLYQYVKGKIRWDYFLNLLRSKSLELNCMSFSSPWNICKTLK